MMEHDYTYKIIVIGDSGTGKTSLLTQLTKGELSDWKIE